MNNEGIEEDWITKAKNKLATRVTEGELREGDELGRERARFAEVKRRILARDEASIPNKVNDVEIDLFLPRKNEKSNDFLREATIMHNLLGESLQ